MAIKTIEYTVDLAGITPATEQFAGTQGDHRVMGLVFNISDSLYNAVTNAVDYGKAKYRFDIYDGEGGVWSSEAAELTNTNLSIELEERHTRYGGKITVYLVITALTSENETEIELYSFPAKLRLRNRPDGMYQDGENYESVTSLAEKAKTKADEAFASAMAAEASNQELQQFAASIEEKLKNGYFDGLGIKSTEIVNDELIITYTDNTVQNLGNVKGQKGDQGEQGIQGEKGDTEKIGEDKVVSGGFISIAENGFLSDINFTTDAPQNTAVRIYNENCVDENAFSGMTTQGKQSYFEVDIVNMDDSSEFPIYSQHNEYGEFVFNKTHSMPEELGQYRYSKMRVAIGNQINDIDITIELIEGDTYCIIASINEESVLVGGEEFETKYTVDKIYLLNKTKSVVEKVNSNGSISTSNIKPCTIAHFDFDSLEDFNNYTLNLTYTVSDFVTKGYVDGVVGDIQTALDELHNYAQAIIGGAE